jgi:hypothetical protein
MVGLQIVNLVSNDVRRFDDAMPFWVFLWGGPLELICVLILLSMQLGPPAAFAGVATMLLVIPTQVQTYASQDISPTDHCFLQKCHAILCWQSTQKCLESLYAFNLLLGVRWAAAAPTTAKV